MSNLPSYPPPPGPPGQPPQLYPRPKKPTNWLAYILGAFLGAPAVGLGAVGGLGAIGSAFGNQAAGLFGALGLVLAIGVPIALIVPERTRPWGIGILIGYAVWAIVAAGACVVLIAAITSSESG